MIDRAKQDPRFKGVNFSGVEYTEGFLEPARYFDNNRQSIVYCARLNVPPYRVGKPTPALDAILTLLGEL